MHRTLDARPGKASMPSDRPSALADRTCAASELRDRIEIWVNEGGAGGEANR